MFVLWGMQQGHVPHMSVDEFRRRGKEAVDFIADYWERVGTLPVLCPLKPGETMGKMPAHPPERGEPWEDVRADLERIMVPGLTHWQSPSFFAYFPANGSFPAIIADMISTGLGVQGMLWATSPACTEVETRVLDWLVGMLGLPDSFLSTGSGGGVIHSTASEGVLTALVAARHRKSAGCRGGVALDSATMEGSPRVGAADAKPSTAAPHFVIYTSTQAHSSVIKAAMIAGLARSPEDRTHVRLIGTDGAYAMRTDLLARAMEEDVAVGRTPLFVVATIGTTSSTAVDPVASIGAVCRRHGAWMHVDAAFAGAALVCPEMRWMSRGVELADSFVFNPHKWMLTSFDCSCFWTSDRAALVGALSIAPEYLRNAASQSGEVIDYRDWQIPLGRRFRALKLWMVIRHYGVEGLRAYIREHVRIAALFEDWVKSDERFEVVAARTSALVCFRLRARAHENPEETDGRNNRLMKTLNERGEMYLTHTVLPEINSDGCEGTKRVVLRMAIGATQTTERHVRDAWEKIRKTSE
jgi:aromatic-L-amino-acid decarboxylase